MSTDDSWTDAYFLELVNWLGKSCWVNLGKVEDPIIREKRVNLKEARVYMSMLEMLQHKTRGNLNQELSSLLEKTINTLHEAYQETEESQSE